MKRRRAMSIGEHEDSSDMPLIRINDETNSENDELHQEELDIMPPEMIFRSTKPEKLSQGQDDTSPSKNFYKYNKYTSLDSLLSEKKSSAKRALDDIIDMGEEEEEVAGETELNLPPSFEVDEEIEEIEDIITDEDMYSLHNISQVLFANVPSLPGEVGPQCLSTINTNSEIEKAVRDLVMNDISVSESVTSELIVGGWLQTLASPSDGIMGWLFHLSCYNSNLKLASDAFSAFHSLLGSSGRSSKKERRITMGSEYIIENNSSISLERRMIYVIFGTVLSFSLQQFHFLSVMIFVFYNYVLPRRCFLAFNEMGSLYCMLFPVRRKLAVREPMIWVPSVSSVVKILIHFGADATMLTTINDSYCVACDEACRLRKGQKGKEEAVSDLDMSLSFTQPGYDTAVEGMGEIKVPITNLRLLLDVLSLCISARPEGYSKDDLLNLSSISMMLYLDPVVISSLSSAAEELLVTTVAACSKISVQDFDFKTKFLTMFMSPALLPHDRIAARSRIISTLTSVTSLCRAMAVELGHVVLRLWNWSDAGGGGIEPNDEDVSYNRDLETAKHILQLTIQNEPKLSQSSRVNDARIAVYRRQLRIACIIVGACVAAPTSYSAKKLSQMSLELLEYRLPILEDISRFLKSLQHTLRRKDDVVFLLQFESSCIDNAIFDGKNELGRKKTS